VRLFGGMLAEVGQVEQRSTYKRATHQRKIRAKFIVNNVR
jgi:hypothetical protein